MIAYVRGKVLATTEETMIVDVNGLGYEIYCSAGAFAKASVGETEYPHIPDWYSWQRECVKKELEDGTYLLDTDVQIAVQVNLKGVCNIGKGHLRHDENGFHLTGADGKLDYKQSPLFSHTVYSDYYWYEIGDVIGIGDNEFSYFCFPSESVSVTKVRLAAEELYKMKKLSRNARGDSEIKTK